MQSGSMLIIIIIPNKHTFIPHKPTFYSKNDKLIIKLAYTKYNC